MVELEAMTRPIKVSKKAFRKFQGERWNAMIHLLALSPLHDLTPVQRTACLAFWYDSEVNNGGHWQYFCNRDDDPNEVIASLKEIGAKEQARILKEAVATFPEGIKPPTNVEEFIAGYDELGMENLDNAFYACAKSIDDCLEDYLDRHESEFIEWVE
jgi:Domain of unknown function (DUF4375)